MSTESEHTAEVRSRDHSVYRAYDDRDRLLYVGCTFDVDDRWKNHHSASRWFPLATRRTVSMSATFAEAREAEAAAIAREHPMFNMNEPCRGEVLGARRSVEAAARTIAARDGWRMNDVHDIGRSTASLIAPDYPTGAAFNCAGKWEALSRRDWFHLDPLPFVWTGYQLLVEAGWKPGYSPEPRFHFIPESWDTTLYGDFSREVWRTPQP